jgi:hypothetical protein
MKVISLRHCPAQHYPRGKSHQYTVDIRYSRSRRGGETRTPVVQPVGDATLTPLFTPQILIPNSVLHDWKSVPYLITKKLTNKPYNQVVKYFN